MEKAVLKTLIYANIFDYPLKGYEIHKWLIGRKLTLHQVEKILGRLLKKRRIQSYKEYFFLNGNKELVSKRLRKEKQSLIYLRKAKILLQALKLIPSIKLVGISGGLALNNTSKTDDIDLFIITSKGRLWLSRLLAILILDILGVRRKAKMNKVQTFGKLCLNILLEEDKLEQVRKDIYIAHEVLQMKVLWQSGGVYSKYLLDNGWVFKFLPNWITPERLMIKNQKSKIYNHKSLVDIVERFARWLQLKIMQPRKGMERIDEGALYFHPLDYRLKVLEEYRQRLKELKI